MANNNNNKRSHLPNDNDDRETTSTRKYGICRCLGRLVPVVKFVSRENKDLPTKLPSCSIPSNCNEEFHVDDKNKRTECSECYSSVEAFFVSLEERWKVIYLCKNEACSWVSDIFDATRLPISQKKLEITNEKLFWCCCDYRAEQSEVCINMDGIDDTLFKVNIERSQRITEIPCPFFDSEASKDFTEDYPYITESSLLPID